MGDRGLEPVTAIRTDLYSFSTALTRSCQSNRRYGMARDLVEDPMIVVSDNSITSGCPSPATAD